MIDSKNPLFQRLRDRDIYLCKMVGKKYIKLSDKEIDDILNDLEAWVI